MKKILSTPKIQWQILLLGYLHWFFGNFYEMMVFTPNVAFAKSIPHAIKTIQEFWSVTEPPWYFLPWNPLTVLLTWIMIANNFKKVSAPAKPYYISLLVASLLITGVTAYIIVNVNTKFYFDKIDLSDNIIIHYWWIGFWLGNFRVLLEVIILFLVGRILHKRYFNISSPSMLPL